MLPSELTDVITEKFNIQVLNENSDTVQLVDLKTFYGVITKNWLFDAELSGIPEEMVIRVYKDHDNVLVQVTAQLIQ